MNDNKCDIGKEFSHIELRLFGASSVGAIKPPTLTIMVSGQIHETELPDFGREIYKNQARELADALIRTLSGGTIDALLVELMSRRASLLSVPLNPGVSGW